MIQPAAPLTHAPGASRWRDFDDSPQVVFYEVTRACDYACRYCRSCPQPAAHSGELGTLDALRLIGQFGEFPAPPELTLFGGDPLKRADILKLVRCAVDSHLKVSMALSATPLATAEAISQLRDAGVGELAVGVDGADADAHDGIRGVAGSFDRSLQILADAQRAGVRTRVNTTIARENVDQLDRLAELLAERGIATWSVSFVVPVGRSITRKRLSPRQYELAFERLWQHSQQQLYAIKTDGAPQFRRYVIRHQLPRAGGRGMPATPAGFIPLGVNDGKGMLFVSHVGMIHPSVQLPIICGMYPLDHVVHVYQRSAIFRALRDPERLQGKCKVCEFRHLCGGCRARAFAVTGNPLAQEPDCCYQPAALQAAGGAS